MARCARAVGRPGGVASLSLALLSTSLPACRVAGAATGNLDELLAEDHSFRYVARVQTGTRYLVSQLIDPEWLSPDSPLRSDRERPVPNPSRLALQSLLDLGDGGLAPDEHWLHAEQVRQFVRYAVYCPSALARERCQLELAEHAQRLELREPPTPGERAPANAPEISEALAGLVQALDAMVQSRGVVDATTRTDFVAACRLLEGLELDVDGGWRLLKVVSRFGLVSRVSDEELEPLFRLSGKVQRDLVGLALAHGRSDPSARVRAAAWRANYAAYGPDFLLEALAALTLAERGEDGAPLRTPRFGLAPEWRSGEDDVFLAVLGLVGDDGLPAPRGATAAERRSLRFRQLFALVQIAHDFSAYGERSRAAAMLALGNVSGAGVRSLRKEDWERWWDEHRDAEAEAVERAFEAEVRPAEPDDPRP